MPPIWCLYWFEGEWVWCILSWCFQKGSFRPEENIHIIAHHSQTFALLHMSSNSFGREIHTIIYIMVPDAIRNNEGAHAGNASSGEGQSACCLLYVIVKGAARRMRNCVSPKNRVCCVCCECSLNAKPSRAGNWMIFVLNACFMGFVLRCASCGARRSHFNYRSLIGDRLLG